MRRLQLVDARMDDVCQLTYSMLSKSDLDAHRHAILRLLALCITDEDVVADWDLKPSPVNLHDF
jgi:hypothetical protein